jgi:Metallo-peptidase family M12B Reprolysin-like
MRTILPGAAVSVVMMRTLRTAAICPQTAGAAMLPPSIRTMPEVLPKWLPAVVTGLLAVLAAVPSAQAAGSAADSEAAWDHVSARALRAPTPARPPVAPTRFAAFTLDQDALADVLKAAPAEPRRTAAPAPGDGLTISVPTPDGGFERFAVVDSPIMEPGLAAEHPDIATYTARGIDDPTATARLDLTPIGFHASVRSDAGAWYVDPRYADRSEYVAYARDAVDADPYAGFDERPDPLSARPATADETRAGEPNGTLVTLRTYRLALISDSTYATHDGASDTTAAKVALMNRVDQLYEQDLAIRLVLIAGNDALNLDTTAQSTGANGPCGAAACFSSNAITLGCTSGMITRAGAVAGKLAGPGSYDLAHVMLGVDGGGIAGLGVVGQSAKGRGCTGLPTPRGDFFAVDYVAHEMGHQFGAEHTFNGTQGSCAGTNRSTGGVSSVEPGSGSSIMAYAGICGTDDLQDHSDPYFSQASITQISNYVTAAETTLLPQQTGVLNDWDGTDSFVISYNGQPSPTTITRGANFTGPAIGAAIQAIPGWPAGATASVSAVDSSSTDPTATVVVTFGGTLASGAPAALAFSTVTGATGFFGRTALAGASTRRGTASATTNHVPDVSVVGGASHTIPARTPFLLDAAGSDVDDDPLTYLWEENDPAAIGTGTGVGLVSNTKTSGPLFRVFGTAATVTNPYISPAPGENAAGATTWRSFPDLQQIADGNTNAASGTCPTPSPLTQAAVDCFSEFLPTVNRTLHFRVSARDDHPGVGGVGDADATLTVASAGPFRVTSQTSSGTVLGGATLPVTWDVAGTTGNGVNTANVEISLSLDGGLTFPRALASSTPNDGAETVTLPRVATTRARIRVQAVGNVFFDISKADLTIAQTSPVVVTGPASTDLGSATVGAAGAPVAMTFSSTGTGPATTGGIAVGGADAGAVGVVSDGCSSRTIAIGASCTVTVRLAPVHAGAQSATLSLPSDDQLSPTTVALTGTGVAAATPPPTPPVIPAPPAPRRTAPTAHELAASMLGVATPFAAGSAGNLKLFTPAKSTRLGKPKATKLLAVAVCAGGSCSGKATVKLTLTPKAKHKRKTTKTITLVRALRLSDGQGAKLTLKLSAKDRKAIKASKKATVTLTVTNGTKKVSRTYTLTVG